jgi:hypothetical protein
MTASTAPPMDDSRPISFAISPRHLWAVLAFLVGGGGAGLGTSLLARPSSEVVEAKLDRVSERLAAIELTLARADVGAARDGEALRSLELRVKALESAR